MCCAVMSVGQIIVSHAQSSIYELGTEAQRVGDQGTIHRAIGGHRVIKGIVFTPPLVDSRRQ